MTYADKQELEMLISTDKRMKALGPKITEGHVLELHQALDLAFLAGAQSALALIAESETERMLKQLEEINDRSTE